MAPKGDSNKVKDGTVTVNIDDFTRTRDSVSFLSFFSLLSAFLLELRAFVARALGKQQWELPGAFTWSFIWACSPGFGSQHRWLLT